MTVKQEEKIWKGKAIATIMEDLAIFGKTTQRTIDYIWEHRKEGVPTSTRELGFDMGVQKSREGQNANVYKAKRALIKVGAIEEKRSPINKDKIQPKIREKKLYPVLTEEDIKNKDKYLWIDKATRITANEGSIGTAKTYFIVWTYNMRQNLPKTARPKWGEVSEATAFKMLKILRDAKLLDKNEEGKYVVLPVKR